MSFCLLLDNLQIGNIWQFGTQISFIDLFLLVSVGSIPADHAFTQFQSGSCGNIPVRQERRLGLWRTRKIHSPALSPFALSLQHFMGSYQQSGQYHPTTHEDVYKRQAEQKWIIINHVMLIFHKLPCILRVLFLPEHFRPNRSVSLISPCLLYTSRCV